MAGVVTFAPFAPTILGVNTAINFTAGVPGAAGAASDTILLALLILKAAGPPILTVNSGFRRETLAQDTTHYVFTGSITVDTYYNFGNGLINSAGALQLTASVANTVIVFTGAAPGGYVS